MIGLEILGVPDLEMMPLEGRIPRQGGQAFRVGAEVERTDRPQPEDGAPHLTPGIPERQPRPIGRSISESGQGAPQGYPAERPVISSDLAPEFTGLQVPEADFEVARSRPDAGEVFT